MPARLQRRLASSLPATARGLTCQRAPTFKRAVPAPAGGAGDNGPPLLLPRTPTMGPPVAGGPGRPRQVVPAVGAWATVAEQLRLRRQQLAQQQQPEALAPPVQAQAQAQAPLQAQQAQAPLPGGGAGAPAGQPQGTGAARAAGGGGARRGALGPVLRMLRAKAAEAEAVGGHPQQ